MAVAEYGRVLKPFLPSDAFRPVRRDLWWIALHLAMFVATCLSFRVAPWWTRPLLTVVVANLLACLAFRAHDLSHGSIIGESPARYALELLLWGLNLIPRTVWRRVHNQTHHHLANTPNDPDRNYFESEVTTAVSLYVHLFYPHRRTPRWNLLVWFHFVPYIARNVITLLAYPGATKPSVAPARPAVSRAKRVVIGAELATVFALQFAIFQLAGGQWATYVWAGPIAVLCTSAIIVVYAFTNHWLNPVGAVHDPVKGTTSVRVPGWVNALHSNFSYHTEHHVFPAMNPAHYPRVAALLAEHFPDRYNSMPLAGAWRQLWNGEPYASFEQPRPRIDVVEASPSAVERR